LKTLSFLEQQDGVKHAFDRTDLEACADGELFGEGNAQLPSSPLLMLDRIIDIQASGGQYDRGFAVAELDISPDSWFFKHHFRGDPVMPGCLLTESLWQLTGFHMAWCGYERKGRVLGSGRTRFLQPVSAKSQSLTISVQIRKIIVSECPIYISNGEIRKKDLVFCQSDAIKVGLFN
jgi:3-hydroxyacyl-[acyl-carrier protein] dehydratase/trans-2-decenoyl-[acyl-carrier protein] isomerase